MAGAQAGGDACSTPAVLPPPLPPCCRRPPRPPALAPCSYNKTAKKIVGKGGQRWYKNIGLGFRTPKEAIEGALPGWACLRVLLLRELACACVRRAVCLQRARAVLHAWHGWKQAQQGSLQPRSMEQQHRHQH